MSSCESPAPDLKAGHATCEDPENRRFSGVLVDVWAAIPSRMPRLMQAISVQKNSTGALDQSKCVAVI
jgi:hypothetical protein